MKHKVLKCPNCKHPIGCPPRLGESLSTAVPITSEDMVICNNCFDILNGTDGGGLRKATSLERAFLIAKQGANLSLIFKAILSYREVQEQRNN